MSLALIYANLNLLIGVVGFVENKYGRLAQLVEQLIYTEKVRGSSPLPPTNERSDGCGREESHGYDFREDLKTFDSFLRTL